MDRRQTIELPHTWADRFAAYMARGFVHAQKIALYTQLHFQPIRVAHLILLEVS